MPNQVRTSQVIRFATFEVDLQTQELRKAGMRLRLPAQSFQVLKMLLERPGGLVTRDEFQCALWPSDTFVDFEHGVNTAVNRLREALGDSADNPKFIETLSRRGYRFIAPVLANGTAAAAVADAKLLATSGPESAARKRPLGVLTLFGAVILLL